MATEKIEMIRYSCDSKIQRVDCWNTENYEYDRDAKQDGWTNNGKEYLCPYCSSKERKYI